jgi:hypothetical protein
MLKRILKNFDDWENLLRALNNGKKQYYSIYKGDLESFHNLD